VQKCALYVHPITLLSVLRTHSLEGTSIRLPVGYFTLGPNFCKNTPFAPYSEVYTNCWSTVKTLISRARACGIGVLIDFHAAPGGANAGEHSGTNSGKAELWNNQSNLSLSQKCLEFIAGEITSGSMDGVIGLEVCNEAIWDAPGMYQWYDSVLAGIATLDPTIPVYISDAWDLGKAITYVKTKNTVTLGSSEPATNPVCIDNHVYFCFTDQDKSCSPQQILPLVSQQLGQMDGKDGSVLDSGAASVIVGEYSCVLNDATWSKGGNYDKSQLVGQFGKAQSQRFQQRTGGSYFWNFKMDWMDGGEWGFVAQTNSGAISPPGNLALSTSDVKAAISRAQSQQSACMQGSVAAHVNYWKQAAAGMKTDHSNFGSGWSVGWNDALAFFSMRVNGGLPGGGGDKIGLLDLWVRKRLAESGMTGDFVWEFEQGFRKGVADFYSCAGI
jgi:hypothetical protein